MTAPISLSMQPGAEPPKPSVNVVINAVLQPIVWGCGILIVCGGFHRFVRLDPFTLMVMAAIFLSGLWMLYRSVCRAGLISSILLATGFVLVSAFCIQLGIMMFSTEIRLLTSFAGLTLLGFIMFCIWSAVTFVRWSGRVDEWERTRLTCDDCGYNLIATLHDGLATCPECGSLIRADLVDRFKQSAPAGPPAHE